MCSSQLKVPNNHWQWLAHHNQPTDTWPLCSYTLHSLVSYFWQHTTTFKWLDDSVTDISAQENNFIIVCSMWKPHYTNTKYHNNKVLEGEKMNLEPLYRLSDAGKTVSNSTMLFIQINYTYVGWLTDLTSWENSEIFQMVCQPLALTWPVVVPAEAKQ